LSSPFLQRSKYPPRKIAGAAGANPYAVRRTTTPLRFGLTLVLLVSLVLLGLAAITRYTVAKPLLPDWLAKTIHYRQPSLPPGMTYDFSVIDPATNHPLVTLPEVGNVEVRLAVTNDSALPMTLRFHTGEQCEFVVRQVFTVVGLFALPIEKWRSSYFHIVSQKPTVVILQPGETKIYAATFALNALNADQMPPGEYRIVASFDAISTGRWEISIPIDKPL
jgi:hypothetical protein